MVKFLFVFVLAFVFFILLFHPYYSYVYRPSVEQRIPEENSVVVADLDEDGFPDAVDLFDRSDCISFRAWFVSVAISQYYHYSRYWDRKNRDCAGLVRFSFIEALKRHTQKWCDRQAFILYPDAGDVRKYNYPDVPIIGVNVFRIRGGKFESVRDFDSFADASTLLSYNMRFISKDLHDAKIGDILAFYHPDKDEPYHMMIYAGKIGSKVYLVYHTGSLIKGMRLISVDNLKRHPDVSWHPIKENKDFLGVFSWKILH